MSLRSKITESLDYRGVLGTVRTCLRLPLQPVLGRQSFLNYQERRFDRRFGVDTAGIIARENLRISGPAAEQAIHYQAAQPLLFEEAITGLKIDYRDYIFVDYGCGKGKAVLMASSFPFRRIVGVELSTHLAAIASGNIRRYKARRQRCRALEIVCADATEFEPPDAPLVCFFYNPFREAVMSRVLDKLEQSWNANPRDLHIVYLYPELDGLFRRRNFLVNTRDKSWCQTYRSRS
jgi:SAM-dependent methyltransferase